MQQPYINTSGSTGNYQAFFALRLDSMARNSAAKKDEYERLLNAQSDFIATLAGMGEGETIELRYLSEPDAHVPAAGRVTVVLRVGVTGEQKSAAEASSRALFASFFPSLLGMSDHYSWQPVRDSSEFASLFPETSKWHMRELVRKERYITLDNSEVSTQSNPLGFHVDPRPVKKPSKSRDVYVCFPFIRTFDRLDRFFSVFLRQPGRVAVSVQLTPTMAQECESKFLLDQLLACERYVQLPLTGAVSDVSTFYPSFRQQASVLAAQLQNDLNSLRDELFYTTICMLGEYPLSDMLCQSLGVTVTEHSNTTDPESDVAAISRVAPYSGGYDWLSPRGASENGSAIRSIKAMKFAGLPRSRAGKAVRVQRLLDVAQASCVFRLPLPGATKFPGVATNHVAELPPPVDASKGLYLGTNRYRSGESPVYLAAEDRLRHMYLIGKTGTGKSTFLKNSVLQDVMSGRGVGVFDPHGELIDDIIPHIPPSRIDDVILIKPEYEHLSVGLNLLDVQTELEKDSVISFLVEVFNSIYDMEHAGGPMFELFFRNALLLLMSDNGFTPTIMDIHRLFEDKSFRNERLDACGDELVTQFWRGNVLKASGEASLASMSNYIVSKLVRFTHISSMRRMFSQRQSTIDFSDVIENKKILLVDLSKGELGSVSSSFLGMTLIKLIQIVAFRRRSVSQEGPLTPFHLYVDEFQNLATPSFVELLSESRKYGIAMMLANQYVHQIPEAIRNAMLGNVGTTVAFRVGPQDAEFLENVFAPEIGRSTFLNLPNFNAYASMLVNGDMRRPFNIAPGRTSYPVNKSALKNVLARMPGYTTRNSARGSRPPRISAV